MLDLFPPDRTRRHRRSRSRDGETGTGTGTGRYSLPYVRAAFEDTPPSFPDGSTLATATASR